MTNFLYRNIRWTLNRKTEDNLLTLATTEKQYVAQLYKLAEKYYPQRRQVNVIDAEFDLNQVALLRSKNDAVRLAKNRFEAFWSSYLQLKNLFGKSYLVFPANDCKTRIEAIAELITKCSQFAVNDALLERMIDCARDIMQLDEKESRHLPSVVELYKLIYYSKATLSAARGRKNAEVALAKMLKPNLLNQAYAENNVYLQSRYESDKLLSVIDCMGNSATIFDDIATKISLKLYMYANGRNVFDTFVKSRFGVNSCEFCSQSKTLDVTMKYFVVSNAEIRKMSVKNKSKVKRKFTAEAVTKRCDVDAHYFCLGNNLCIAANNERLYVANAIVHNCVAVDCCVNNAQSYEFYLRPNEQIDFDVVTLYAHDTPSLATELANLEYLGATACPYLFDAPSNKIRRTDVKLNLTSHGYALKKPHSVQSERLNYTYQLGDADTATFVDNGGNSATLIKGFVFGVGGEGVYSARGGIMDKINEGSFHIDVDTLRYDKNKSSCVISHGEGKEYAITHVNACKTLFLFPFEQASKVTLRDKTFLVEDDERRYAVTCYSEVESYTTNALECNEDKLRYKLSGDLSAGTCLAVCFKAAQSVKLTIKSLNKTPTSQPIVRESLVSTYLNYINDKNAFCLSNYLKRPDGLTVAAICYTNPQFVKQYLETRFKTQRTTYYYDVTGRKKPYEDKSAFALAYAYYRNLVGDDLPKSYLNAVNGVIFGESYEGRDVCLKALTLKKLAQLNTEDKVRYLVEYNLLKKQIENDSKLYAYAQAIGALPMINPSKARLKDLCNKYDIPKCWYYVSQLENLYGLNISPNKLHICPKVTAENVLEQLALNIDGKRIDTTFTKATVHSMTLNGTQFFQPFSPSSLKKADNQLVVRY